MRRYAASWLCILAMLLAGAAIGAEPDGTWTTDLDDLKERRVVRLLVAYDKTFYFIDGGEPHGISHELGLAFERELKIPVMFIPVRRDRLLPSLIEGRGDIAAVNMTITPERLKQVDFSAPFAEGVSEVFVASSKSGTPESLYDLSGRSVFVRRSSSYFASLENLNRTLRARGKPPARIVLADENLEDEDILEMVNADLVSATVVDSYLAKFWGQLLPDIRAHPQAALRGGAQIAWAIRKDSPQLKAALDAFVTRNRVGTAPGNLLLQRYLQHTRWAKSATAEADMRRFSELSKYFRKYATQYRFEWLMLVAQGYQYVSNIFKYYIAYKLVVERGREREAIKRKAQ